MTESRDMVALIHGIAESKLVFAPFMMYLRKNGFDVLNIDYPWQETTIDRLTAEIHRSLSKGNAFAAPKLHFVTHSMGGLILRSWLTRHRPENLGRTVMLAPPHRGSEFADMLSDHWLYKAFYGPAGQELTTAARSAWGDHPVDFELGVIAGDNAVVKAINNAVMGGPNDGVVSVESTKIDGMKDHIVMDTVHVAIVADPRVWKQATRFIREGAFDKP